MFFRMTSCWTVLIIALSTTPPTRAATVAIWGEEEPNLHDVQAKIGDRFDRVDVVDLASEGVPTLATAQAYDAIMVFGGGPRLSNDARTQAGNVLADYADAGGGVVTCTFALGSNTPAWTLLGRWNDDFYHVMKPVSSQHGGPQSLGTVYVADHPVMAGVDTFEGGSSSYRVPITTLAPYSVLVADWTDGKPLVAVKELPGFGRRVDLNMFPPSSDVRGDFWTVGTDGDVLMANAIEWAAVPEPSTLGLLLAMGIAGMAFCAIRRRTRARS